MEAPASPAPVPVHQPVEPVQSVQVGAVVPPIDPEAAFFNDEAPGPSLEEARVLPPRRWLVPAALALGVLAVGALALAFLSGRDEPVRPVVSDTAPTPSVGMAPEEDAGEAETVAGRAEEVLGGPEEDAGPSALALEVSDAGVGGDTDADAEGRADAEADVDVDAGAEAEAAAEAGAAESMAAVGPVAPEGPGSRRPAGTDAPPAVTPEAGTPRRRSGADLIEDGASPRRASPPSDTYAEAVEEARAALAQQRFKTAVTLYRKVVKMRTPTASVLLGLGIALVRSESESGYREAIPYLNFGLEEEPRNAQGWLALGIAYQNLGRAEDAKGPYREYLKLRPTGAQADEIRNALRNSTK